MARPLRRAARLTIALVVKCVADDIKNLWPQPYLTPGQPGAYAKDKLENWLHKQVCITQTMSLEQTQQTLMGDWYEAYEKAGLDK
jgi:hypothetical protein